MATVLYFSTILLQLAGVAFSIAFIWLNAFSKATDLASRNAGLTKITKTCMALAMVFALLSCLLTNSGKVDEAIDRAAVLYSIIAISWLAVLLVCGIAMLTAFLSKTAYKKSLLESLRKIGGVAIAGTIIGMVFAWLLG